MRFKYLLPLLLFCTAVLLFIFLYSHFSNYGLLLFVLRVFMLAVSIRISSSILLCSELYWSSEIYFVRFRSLNHIDVSLASFSEMLSFVMRSFLLCAYLLSAILAAMLVPLLKIWFDKLWIFLLGLFCSMYSLRLIILTAKSSLFVAIILSFIVHFVHYWIINIEYWKVALTNGKKWSA